jgi:hypothetical protein
MKVLMIGGEYLVGLLILFLTLLCIVVAGVLSLIEFPNYLRHMHK